MTDRAPVETKNLDRYGYPELPWDRPRDILAVGSLGPGATHFLGTTRPDGRAHAAGVGAIWLDGDLYFTSSPMREKRATWRRTRPARSPVQLEGIDLVFEGEAARITDVPTLEQAAAIYREAGRQRSRTMP